MVSILASPSAAVPAASTPARLCTGTRQLQPSIISLYGDRALHPVSARCHGHAGQMALNISPSSRPRGLLPMQVTACLKSAAPYSHDLRLLASNTLTSSTQRKMNATKSHRSLTVCCEYGGGSKGISGGDFFAGFLLGGAICGTLTYIFAPQIRRSLLHEDEHGFRRGIKPIYYDDGLEKNRQTLNEKINQLNSAIENVSSRLRVNSAIENVSSRLRGKGNDMAAKVASEVEGLEDCV